MAWTPRTALGSPASARRSESVQRADEPRQRLLAVRAGLRAGRRDLVEHAEERDRGQQDADQQIAREAVHAGLTARSAARRSRIGRCTMPAAMLNAMQSIHI